MGETDCGNGRKKITVAKEAVMEWSRSIPKDAKLGLVAFFITNGLKCPFMQLTFMGDQTNVDRICEHFVHYPFYQRLSHAAHQP